ncbi:MAG: alpha/beta hydrolase, partial [Eudoraea sp.]|nr:alpha/beta hydrolase [Eudoraea sp.]
MNRVGRIFGVLIVFIIFAASMLYFIQEKLIFLPTKLPVDFEYSFQYPFEEVFLTAEDGAVLNALHFKNKDPKGVILYFHGNAGDLSRWGQIATYFVKKNYDVVIMDYRTYGKSTGVLSEEALK